jgi:hypothetical protein
MLRLGLNRAYGPVLHPICFGTLQLLLFPWTIYAFSLSRRGAGPTWWQATPWVGMIGIIFAISRAPFLAVLALLYATAVILRPRWRPALIATGGVAGLVLLVQWNTVVNLIHAMTGDKPHQKGVTVTVGDSRIRIKKEATIHVDGEEVVRTSAMVRLYLFDVYGKAIRSAGFLGYGTDRVTGKPMRVPVSAEHVDALRVVWVENGYVLYVLRFGYLGVLFFVCLNVAAATNFVRLGWNAARPGSAFYAGMAGAIVATMLVLMTVWMPRDFGFLLVWTAGASAGLWACRGSERQRTNATSARR